MSRKRHLGKNRPISPQKRKDDALAALKTYQAEGIVTKMRAGVTDVLINESDRGAIILVGSAIEDVLAAQIAKRLRITADFETDMFKTGGPLGGFQAKITMGRALGIVDGDLFEQLDLIRLLRNACAHSVKSMTLNTPAIKGVFSLLLTENATKQVADDDTPSNMMRVVLSLVFVYLLERLNGRTEAAAQDAVNAISDQIKRGASAPPA